jgi:succinyl-CoA synthetase alpha subunit
MSILVNEQTRLICQGMTGKAGTLHAKGCKAYAKTQLVGGVRAGKGKTRHPDPELKDVPLFDTVYEAVAETGANTSMVFVPAYGCADAILEAADAGIRLIVAITEGVPVLDMVRAKKALESYPCRLIGPNCPGVITSDVCKVGIMPGNIHKKGRVGVLSRSGTLTYEAVGQLSDLNIGQSSCVGIGGDPVNGTNFVDVLKLFQNDPETDALIMIGEIGGTAEEEAAEYIQSHFKKPVVGFIAGATAPSGKRMGHAGAIISGNQGTAQSKKSALERAGVRVCESPADLGKTMKAYLSEKKLL